MNGAQDLGGMQAFGPIRADADVSLFHADWERRVLAITLAMGAVGKWNIDMSRAARESLPPAQYLSSSYYQIWFEGLIKLLLSTGLATAEEIGTGESKSAAAPVPRVLMADGVAAALLRGSPADRPAAADARFKVGDRVQTRQLNPSTHTRLPRYCRGRRGHIIAVHGAHVFPDANAVGLGEQPQWLYTVRFDAAELWGTDTTAASVCVDCWEPYLDYPNAGSA
ncbi:Low-molecular weight cobalt-containing nitrile hydratase subunit beta [Paraburkholderia sediminicola]|uniref:Nitrile hydratase subunit beta n=1 Tax=Paraburkholderia sediminicola TaxID=458836 RepID=A0A6J5A3D6_9BURK|nr:nitrile hydratase subunit beta [Paraburkholderia sediminicola]CAB3652277.1 Low-molecular weight cobalt-containing nitrile hydratase subunit beta [Paraburkholderia sediminicola]